MDLGPRPCPPSVGGRCDAWRVSAPEAAIAAVTLVLGPEELLADRAVSAVRRAVRAADPDADVHDLAPGTLEPGMLDELTSPSLFAERRLVVVRGADELPAPVAAELEARLADPGEDVNLVVLHKGGARGKGVLEAARRAGAVVVDCAEVKKPADKLAFVSAEFRLAGRRIAPDAARALLDAVGSDLRELACACSQLVADTSGPVDAEVVQRYYAGRAEVSSFTVADLAVEGRTTEALAHLRWALASGVEPVLLTSALAMGLRGIARVGDAPRGMRPADLARELKLPPWKLDRIRGQLRGWDADGVAAALAAVAVADADVKGAAVDPAYALERVVVTVSRARRG
jgi:DNA polymerase III subunit delta